MPDLLALLPAVLTVLPAVPGVLAVAGGGGQAPPEGELDPNTVTPGPVGFIVTFALVVVVVLLLRDFSRRVRRLKLRGEAQEREEAARAVREAGGSERPAGTAPTGGPLDGGRGRPPQQRPQRDDGTAPGDGTREGG